MKLLQTTKKWVDWWSKRKIDWNVHYMNPNHPHRQLMVVILQKLQWLSLIEVGCGAGANLAAILKTIPNKQVGGIDVNKDAIELAKKTFQRGIFRVSSVDDMMLSDKSSDVVLSDMCMIYFSPRKIGKCLDEIRRVARSYVVFCELDSEHWWERLAIKWKEGYNVYDWKKLLEKHNFYDVSKFKIAKEAWPESDLQQKYCHIIVACVGKDY